MTDDRIVDEPDPKEQALLRARREAIDLCRDAKDLLLPLFRYDSQLREAVESLERAAETSDSAFIELSIFRVNQVMASLARRSDEEGGGRGSLTGSPRI